MKYIISISFKMTALLVISKVQAKQLIAKAIAKKIKSTHKRVYISYGSTNQLILAELGIEKENYYNGYIDKNNLSSNKNRPSVVVLNGNETDFIDSITKDDIIIKGANALSYEDGEYKAAVAVASPDGGTYGNIILKASCVGSEVIIPVSHEKLVPKIYNNKYNQNSFDFSMGLPVSLFKYDYGTVFTEIDAFSELYNLDAKLYISGSIGRNSSAFSFIVEGLERDITNVMEFLTWI